ncbi:hypothetical protein DXG01_000033 [Tephrocybe rancida]|nr:hypothetical protein DXG01_000033 [Tephrocybe rancida]
MNYLPLPAYTPFDELAAPPPYEPQARTANQRRAAAASPRSRPPSSSTTSSSCAPRPPSTRSRPERLKPWTTGPASASSPHPTGHGTRWGCACCAVDHRTISVIPGHDEPSALKIVP